MNPLPQIPTDNLYKFISIAGLVTFFLSFYAFQKQSNEYTLKTQNYITTLKRNIFESNCLTRDYKNFSEEAKRVIEIEQERGRKLDKAIKNKLAGNSYSVPPDNTKSLHTDLITNRTKLDQISDSLEIKRIEADGLDRELKVMKSLVEESQFISILGSIVGTILTGIGFRLWYTKVQRPMDRYLLNQILPPTLDTPDPLAPDSNDINHEQT